MGLSLFQFHTNGRQKPVVLADILAPERNSFGVLRLMLALAVLISHAIFLRSGTSTAEPLVQLTGYSLGQYGVQGFMKNAGSTPTKNTARHP